MTASPFLGVFLHSLGGLAAGSFYIPFRRVRNWSWESYWLVNGVLSWLIVPWVVSMQVCPNTMAILRAAPASSLVWSYVFGVLWGIGGLTFGLSMRYLGMSLGYALALGFCAAFGTIIPPIFNKTIAELARHAYGQVQLLGVLVCLVGIAICGKAGMRKEREVSADDKKAVITEFNFAKGVWVAIFAGIMSACMAFGLEAGKPIADLAAKHGIWQNSPVYIIIFAGGFTTNFVWCALLNIRNRTAGDYVSGGVRALANNYIFAGLAGVIWYCQFMFYGMGTTKMGALNFSSWTIHMAFIIVFSNVWGIAFKEWRGASPGTHRLIFSGIAVLVASTLIVGIGNYLKA